jgi:hypothetical protein
MIIVIRNILATLILANLFGCGLFGGNTVREYNDKCYMLEIKAMLITAGCKYNDDVITEIKILLIDSVSQKYKGLAFRDSLPAKTKNFQLKVPETTKRIIQNEFVKIMLMTSREKTWYDVTVSPSDWRTADYKFLVKNVW